MMRINKPGNRIVLLAGSSALFAQAPTQSGVPDVHQIVQESIAATERSWQGRIRYTYMERDEDRRLDSDGRVKSEQVDVLRIILVDGVPFGQLMERNGKPPSADEERKQKERLDKLKRETPEQRAGRIRREEEETTSLVQELPNAFDFQLVGDDVVNGRPAYVLQATPRPGYQPHGKYGKMFARVGGKLWVDKEDFGWIKADGQVIEPFSLGLFLVRVLRGSHITMEQTRIGDGTWVPEHIEIQAAAKILFVKSLVIDQILSYSEYQGPQAR